LGQLITIGAHTLTWSDKKYFLGMRQISVKCLWAITGASTETSDIMLRAFVSSDTNIPLREFHGFGNSDEKSMTLGRIGLWQFP